MVFIIDHLASGSRDLPVAFLSPTPDILGCAAWIRGRRSLRLGRGVDGWKFHRLHSGPKSQLACGFEEECSKEISSIHFDQNSLWLKGIKQKMMAFLEVAASAAPRTTLNGPMIRSASGSSPVDKFLGKRKVSLSCCCSRGYSLSCFSAVEVTAWAAIAVEVLAWAAIAVEVTAWAAFH